MVTQGRGGEGKGKERKGGERKKYGAWPTSTSPVPVEVGGERGETVQKEDASAGWTCGDWICSAPPLYPSLG